MEIELREIIGWASCYNRLNVIEFLHRHFGKSQIRNTWRNEALRFASLNGHLDIIKFLVSEGANIHTNNDYPLRWASRFGHLDIVKFLVSKGANIHVLYDWALRWASANGHLDVVKFLVSKGADIDYSLKYGTPKVKKYLKSLI